MTFTIWIDADACPKGVKEIVFRAALRLKVPVCLVANMEMPAPRSPYITQVRVSKGFDEADDYITNKAETGDIVITADIPLAANVVAKGALAIDPRGELYSEENVYERLATRDLLQDLRSVGMPLSGPPPFSAVDKRKFAATFDSLLTKQLRNS